MVDLHVDPTADASAVPAPQGSGVQPVAAHRSLRAKGLLAVLALVAYVLGSAAYVSLERGRIQESVQALEQLSRHEKALALAQAAIDGAVIDVAEASSAAATEPMQLAELAQYMETCNRLFDSLEQFDPAYALSRRAIVRSYDALAAAPVRANWIDLREAMSRAAADLEIRRGALDDRRESLMQVYKQRYDAVTIESLALALAGMVAFGTVVAWFFARLARDIRRLELHARQIVRGERGVTLPVAREDELGSLMQAVNRMSADLDEREKQIELAHQRASHQEKMTAVGALAAGVAHEVNNPLAVIAGTAQELKVLASDAGHAQMMQGAELIFEQSQRAAWTARHLAELAHPPSATLDWVDTNAIVRRVVELIRYDKRYRQLQFDSDLSSELPAVHTSGEALHHALMRVMSLGCDAAAAAAMADAAVVMVRSAGSGADRAVTLMGEFPTRLDFSDAAVQRALLLCRSIVEPLRGRLALSQDDQPLLRIALTLPTGGPEGGVRVDG